MAIRIGVNAVIVKDNQILLIEFNDETGSQFNLPGGGVEEGESIHEALCREVREETCAEVDIGRLLMVWEYDPNRYMGQFGPNHKIGIIFECRLRSDSEPSLPTHPDAHQTAVRWFPLADLPSLPVLPSTVKLMAEVLSTQQGAFFTGNL